MKTSNLALITNTEIEQVLALRETKDGLKKRLVLVEANLKEVEGNIIQLIEAHAEINSGYNVAVKIIEKRYPCWRDHFIASVGKEKADIVLLETAPHIYKNLLIK